MHIRCLAFAAAFLFPAGAVGQLTTGTTDVVLHDKTVVRVASGQLQVPESRSRPSARRVTIPFYRLESQSPAPAASIFLLAGGPGGSWLEQFEAEETNREARFYQTTADVVLFDQRWDTSTPIENAREVAASLKQATLVEVIGGNHGALYNLFARWPPMRETLNAFLAGRRTTFPATVDDTAAIRFAPSR
jgi:TAP-like protein